MWGGRFDLTDGLYVAAGAAAFLLVLLLQWLLYSRLAQPSTPALQRWMKYEAALQAMVLLLAGGYLLLAVRRHPPGIAWGVPGAAAVVANALALQVVLFRLMRILRTG